MKFFDYLNVAIFSSNVFLAASSDPHAAMGWLAAVILYVAWAKEVNRRSKVSG